LNINGSHYEENKYWFKFLWLLCWKKKNTSLSYQPTAWEIFVYHMSCYITWNIQHHVPVVFLDCWKKKKPRSNMALVVDALWLYCVNRMSLVRFQLSKSIFSCSKKCACEGFKVIKKSESVDVWMGVNLLLNWWKSLKWMCWLSNKSGDILWEFKGWTTSYWNFGL